jgi:hypothetical protein
MGIRAMLGIAAMPCVLAAMVVGAGPQSAAGAGSGARAVAARPEPLGYRVLRQDVIVNADIWNRRPEIMAAGLGFTGIFGVPNLSTGNVTLSRTLAVQRPLLMANALRPFVACQPDAGRCGRKIPWPGVRIPAGS